MTESLENQLNLGNGNAESAASSGSTMQPVGLTFVILGFAMMVFGVWIYDPTVGSSSLGSYGDRIYNNGLLNRQLGIVMLGAALSITGSVLYAAARIIEAIKGKK